MRPSPALAPVHRIDQRRRARGRILRPATVGLLLLVLVPPATAAAPGPATASSFDVPAPASGVWPLSPRPAVVRGFDPPATRWGSGHRGVDLAGDPLATVRAALAGTVSFAGQLAGRGVVVVDHGGTRTTYEPVTPAVRKGDRVQAGDALGRLQLFGSHCFPRWCLHWGLIEGREHYLDPLTLVGAAPVRLLPLVGGGPPGWMARPLPPAR